MNENVQLLEALQTIEALANEAGFECMGRVNTKDLQVRPEVRDMCAANRCNRYGHSWSCPPACESIDSYQAHLQKRSLGIIVQTVGTMEDSFDFESISETAELHDKRFRAFSEAVRTTAIAKQLEFKPFFLGAGSCAICPSCSYPENPCRFPEKAYISLEAAGYVVNEVCIAAQIPYNHGANTISFSGGVFI